MPDNIINLNDHRTSIHGDMDQAEMLDLMDRIEEALELFEELNVSTRDQLEHLLSELDAAASDSSE